MSSPYPTPPPSGRRRLPTWLAPRRRRIALGAGAIVVAVAIVAVVDPFGSSRPSSAGVTDNAYPTATGTVTEQDLSSQTSVSATLGYAGNYTVALPSGTSASTVTQAQSTVQADETNVSETVAILSAARCNNWMSRGWRLQLRKASHRNGFSSAGRHGPGRMTRRHQRKLPRQPLRCDPI